jgi:hypothetical protein
LTTNVSETAPAEVNNEPVFRTSEQIAADIATSVRDPKRLRELSAEMQETLRREDKAAEDARIEEMRQRLNPLRENFVRVVERTEGLVDYIREHGGVLTFSYSLPAEGSENGPEANISTGSNVRAPSAPRAPRAAGAPSTGGGGRGKTYLVNGQRLALEGAFQSLASAQDQTDLTARVDSAQTDKSKNSAAWAVKSRVVNAAVEAGRASIVE